jgi:hypothetical protein
MTSVPVRAAPVLASAVNWTEAGPVPLEGVTNSQLSKDTAVHGQTDSVPIATDPEPPAAATAADPGVSVKLHTTGTVVVVEVDEDVVVVVVGTVVVGSGAPSPRTIVKLENDSGLPGQFWDVLRPVHVNV